MFRSARDEDAPVADDARNKPRNRASNMPLRVDIDIVEHRVAISAHVAATIGLAFHEHAGDAGDGARRDLRIAMRP